MGAAAVLSDRYGARTVVSRLARRRDEFFREVQGVCRTTTVTAGHEFAAVLDGRNDRLPGAFHCGSEGNGVLKDLLEFLGSDQGTQTHQSIE